MTLLETILQDLRYGVRTLSRNAGFTAVAVFALALGIGLNTAVFTAYKAMVARPFVARNPGEMVNLALIRDSGATDFKFSNPDYEAYRDSVRSFSGLAAFSPEHMRLSTGAVSKPDSVSVFVVSENYFKVLGIGASHGRTFDSIGVHELIASPAVLISDNCWQRRFAGDAAILGKSIHLNGAAVTVIGITPHDFVGTGIAVPDFWFPLSLEPLVHADSNWLNDRENQRYRLFARLASGVDMDRARAEMTILADHLRGLHNARSDSAKHANVLVWPGSPLPLPLKLYKGLTLSILLIMSAAGMVLLVACANVASLQLARARSRQAEMHMRLSLGASRLRLMRQLLTESALLGLLSGAMAFPLTEALLKMCVMLANEKLPAKDGVLIFDVAPDLGIFVYVLFISLGAGILFGLSPAIESSRTELSSSVRGATSSVRGRRIQDFLVTAQVALSLVLMIAGSMLIRSSINALKMETGYDSKHVIDLDFQFPESAKYTSARKRALAENLRARLAALPGVTAITSARPPGDLGFRTAALSLDGERSAPRNRRALLRYTYVQANYFETLSIPLLMGRGFEPQAGEPEASIILSESAAKQLWPEQNPIGRSLRLGVTDERAHNESELVADGTVYQVIGVARETRAMEFDGSDSRKIYLQLPDNRLQSRPMLIRSQIEPAQVIRAIDSVVSSIDPDLEVTSSTLEEMLRQSAPFFASSMSAAIASSVGLIGLLLASMGIYGTVSYIVVLRTREIGIRMAVGAQKRDVLGLILGESTRPVLAGLAVGMVLAVGASYLLCGVLYAVNTVDGVSFVSMSFLFLAVALAAAYPTSRRATRVDPMVALRYE